MSDQQLQIQCPGCSKSLRVPGSLQGKVVSCPNCQMKLQISAPAGQAAAPTPPPAPTVPNVQLPGTTPPTPGQQSAPIAAPPSLTSNATGPPPVPPGGLDPLSPGAGGSIGTPAWGAAGPATSKPKQARKVHKKRVEEEPEETFLGNLGYYLIATAILASLAPLVGLEHRALRHAGEFGPIIGIILGLVGSGLIASKGNSQSFAIAGVCAVLCVGAGIFGYQLKRAEGQPEMGGGFANMTAAEKEAARKEELESLKNPAKFRPASPESPSSGFQTPKIPGFTPGGSNGGPTIPGFNPGPANNNPSIPGGSIPNGRNASAGSDAAEEMMRESERMREESNRAMEEGRRRAAEAQQEFRDRVQNSMNRSPFANRPGGRGGGGLPPFGGPPRGNPGFAGPPNAAGGSSPAGRPPTNPFGGAGRSAGGTGPGSLADFLKRFNAGLDVMQFRARGNEDLVSNYRFEKIAGGEDSFGKIFYSPEPVQAIDFARFDNRVFLLPAKPDDQNEHQILVPDGKALVGLNLAVINGSLSGVQGIFGDPDPKRKGRYNLEQTTTSEWLGDESATPMVAMTKGKPVVGMVVFKSVSDITGIQLITSKQSSR